MTWEDFMGTHVSPGGRTHVGTRVTCPSPVCAEAECAEAECEGDAE